MIIMNTVNMLIGERRRLTVRITAGGQDFTIRNPKYELMRSGEVIASGTPTVSGNDLICMLEPPGRRRVYNGVYIRDRGRDCKKTSNDLGRKVRLENER